MNGLFGRQGNQASKLLAVFGLMLALVLMGGGFSAFAQGNGAQAAVSQPQAAAAPASQANQPQLTGQYFQDIQVGSLFYTFTANLRTAGIVAGYSCGANPSEPCVAPDNLPYYRPANSVRRDELSKFIDNGRRNIADAIGASLVISSTAYDTLIARTNSNGEAIRGECLAVNSCYGVYGSVVGGGEAIYGSCLTAGNNCFAVYGSALAGDYAGYFSGGKGVYVTTSSTSTAALESYSNAASSYGFSATSNLYRGANIKNNSTSWYSLYVDSPTGSTVAGYFNGNVTIAGNLSVSGSKGGYVVDMMQNVDSQALEAGDVVVIAGGGSSEAVYGEIPVVTVKKANSAYDTGVVGVVDQVMSVPSKQMRAAYKAQEDARREAMGRQEALVAAAKDGKTKPASIDIPPATINDVDGSPHPISTASGAATGSYINVVTLGSYKAVKVDASFGPIKAGDLLVASSNPGYAMKASDKSQTSGAVIGKALGSLESGTGTIPVIVTLK